MIPKNPTPQQIALYVASIISLLHLAIMLLIQVIDVPYSNWLMVVLGGLALFAIGYYVIGYALRRYIYRKIKLIYKTIHYYKRGSADKENAISLQNHIMDEVEREVVEWAKDQNQQITALKEQEEYRRNFLGNITHELKTPIFNIQGYLHTLLDGGLYDEAINMNYLRRAAKNVERLHTIVQDLEVISSLEAGRLTLDIQRFDIRELAQEVIEDMEFKANERDIKLQFKEGAGRAYHVRADRENIRQVLVNLVTNSIKYGKEGGRTTIGFYDMDKYILVEVADNGIGIAKEHVTRVFERFYRVDKSRSRSQGGTGLGLAIVKHIIEAHQQTINVRSSQGRGSTFGFTLERT